MADFFVALVARDAEARLRHCNARHVALDAHEFDSGVAQVGGRRGLLRTEALLPLIEGLVPLPRPIAEAVDAHEDL